MTAALVVPAPTVAFEDAGGGVAALEKPVTVTFGPVTASGTPVGPAGLRGFGFTVQRRTAAGASPEVWDDGRKGWVPDGPTATPVALSYQEGQATPWQGILVAAGMKDSSGAPAFAAAVAGYPLYSLYGTFTDTEGRTAAGPPGPNLTFVGASDRALIVAAPGPDEKPETATQFRLLLKDATFQVIGGMTVTRDVPGAVVTVDNAAGAAVVLHADGSIELRPGSGKGITLAGDVETERLTYLPASGGPKQMLG